jgi:hypothetical protein
MVAGTPVDVMAYASSATAVTLELLQWSSPTARATGITQSAYGFWTKAADSSRRYLGTLLPASATTVTQLRKGVGAKGICGIWNADNRVRSQFSWAANVADWTVATANTWLPFNGDANSRVDWVTGLSVEDVVMTGYATLAPTGFDCAIGVGFDVTNAASGLRGYGAGTGITMPGVTAHAAQPGIGAHYAAMLGRSTGTVSHIYGTTSLTAAGMVADLFW